jgi:hypothetical protein
VSVLNLQRSVFFLVLIEKFLAHPWAGTGFVGLAAASVKEVEEEDLQDTGTIAAKRILENKFISSSTLVLRMHVQSGGASTDQIGKAVKIRNEHPKGSPIRQEANKVVHSQDPGAANKYTTKEYAHSDAAEQFIKKYSKK